MSADVVNPTPYPDVNAVLRVLLSRVQAVLGDYFIGMYVHGSAASGELDSQRSDIDFLVVTADELPDEMLLALAAMHDRITMSGLKWAAKLEGSYIPLQTLRRYDPNHSQHPALRVDGSFDVDEHGSDWVIQRHVIREKGIVVAGPAAQTLIDPVQPHELRQAVLATLREWWSPQLHDHSRLQDREYQAYAVLTMCRALYTLQHGTVVSKAVAARRAQEARGERWAALIERPLAWPQGSQSDEMDETLNLIRYTLELAEQHAEPGSQ